MKNITGESFEVRLEENSTIFFKGALRLRGTEDYAPILDMLKETLRETLGETLGETRLSPAAPIVLDLRELDFLNSSGITMFSRFVIEARSHAGVDLHFIASETVPWHARSLRNLQRLMPALNIRMA
jgi:hypothetical protein